MINADNHRADAMNALADFMGAAIGPAPGLELASLATAHALLAIEARLGELVEQQHTANYIAACGDHRPPINNVDEMRQVNETLRRVLGLDDKPEGGSAE